MRHVIFKFGLLAVALMLLLQLSKYSLFTKGFRNELMVTVFAICFAAFGILVYRLLSLKNAGKAQNATMPQVNHGKIKELGISKREYEVLQQISLGKSNKEIAETLFISESTVKTHVSNLLVKLDAKRRTQAVTVAKSLEIV